MNKYIIIFVVSVFLVITGISYFRSCGEKLWGKETETIPPPPIDYNLRNRIDTFLAKNPVEGIVGMEVYDITAQQEVYSYNKDSLMSPASCMKILTCTAALRYMGANMPLRNRLYMSGEVHNDTLVGNIILKTQFDAAFNRDTLNQLIDKLKYSGISYVKGNVLLDMMFTSPMNHEEHWVIGDLRTRYMGILLHGYERVKKEMLSAMHSRGIALIDGQVLYGKLNPRKSILVAENRNTLHSMIEKSLKVSSNINAEALLYPLGYIYDKSGHYRENGKLQLLSFLRNELNVEPSKVCHIDDGCGLCPNDKLSADLLVKLLLYCSKRPYIYDEVIQDMPLAGVDGTLYKRMHHPDIKGKLRGKTGTLTRDGGISSLAGYFIGKDNHLMAYAIINNGCGVENGRAWQDKFCLRALQPQTIMGNINECDSVNSD